VASERARHEKARREGVRERWREATELTADEAQRYPVELRHAVRLIQAYAQKLDAGDERDRAAAHALRKIGHAVDGAGKYEARRLPSAK
jgi:hypothetical protein